MSKQIKDSDRDDVQGHGPRRFTLDDDVQGHKRGFVATDDDDVEGHRRK